MRHSCRVGVLFCVIIAAFVAVEARLVHLQIVRGEHYRSYADRQRVALLPLDVARARILTSDGAVLAEDRLAFDVAVVIGRLDPSGERRIRDPLRRLFYVPRGEKLLRVTHADFDIHRKQGDDGDPCLVAKAWSKLEVEVHGEHGPPVVYLVERQCDEFELPQQLVRSVSELAQLTGEPRDELLERVLRTAVDVARLRIPVFSPVSVIKGVDYETVAAVETRPNEFRGFQVKTRCERATPSGVLAPHLVGYVSDYDPRDVEAAVEKYRGWPGRGYFMTLRAGRAGIEKSLDDILRGHFGMRCIERDNMDRRQRVLANAPAETGRDVVLTIDSRLQKIVERALEHKVGAVVFVEVRTGRILAIASSPKYDPARFSQDYGQLAENPDRPLWDRAVRARYPLGSVFKIVTALAALEKGCVPPSVNCTGSIQFGGRTFRCHRRSGHGTVELPDAFKYSCNIFFYRTAQRAGAEALIGMAARLGLGRKTGVRIPREYGGNLPLTAPGGQLLNLAIGQGELVVTPLQVAQMVATVANDGGLMPLKGVSELRPFDTDSPAAEVLPDERKPRNLGLSKHSLSVVRLGLYKVVNEYGGTGNSAFRNFHRPFEVCGKTGTAARPGDDVGWFVGYAPHKQPRIAFAVAIERLTNGQGGGSTAAPVARRILEAMPLDLLGVEQHGEDERR